MNQIYIELYRSQKESWVKKTSCRMAYAIWCHVWTFAKHRRLCTHIYISLFEFLLSRIAFLFVISLSPLFRSTYLLFSGNLMKSSQRWVLSWEESKQEDLSRKTVSWIFNFLFLMYLTYISLLRMPIAIAW